MTPDLRERMASLNAPEHVRPPCVNRITEAFANRRYLPSMEVQMRKHISFTIAATILGLAMGLWIKDSRVETNAKVARADLSSPMSKPYRAIPVFDLVH